MHILCVCILNAQTQTHMHTYPFIHLEEIILYCAKLFYWALIKLKISSVCFYVLLENSSIVLVEIL